jgi:hypothetical protein
MIYIVLWATFVSFYLFCSVANYRAAYVYYWVEFPNLRAYPSPKSRRRELRGHAWFVAILGPLAIVPMLVTGLYSHGFLFKE